MTAFEQGIDASDTESLAFGLTYTAKGIISSRSRVLFGRNAVNAFLSVQPEVWWCEAHDSKAPPPGPSGNPGLEKCERSRLDAYTSPSTTQYICSMVPVHIVVKS